MRSPSSSRPTTASYRRTGSSSCFGAASSGSCSGATSSSIATAKLSTASTCAAHSSVEIDPRHRIRARSSGSRAGYSKAGSRSGKAEPKRIEVMSPEPNILGVLQLPDCYGRPTCDPRPVCPSCGGLECLCRPRFFAGQLLTDEDLTRLDHYIQAKNRLHNRFLHGWGVACGLEVVCGV